MNEPLKELEDNKQGILFIELAGLFHDIGKLSRKFLQYRKEWQDDPNGWDKESDPHAHKYLRVHEGFKTLIPDEFRKEIKFLNCYDFGENDFSIWKAVHDHHEKNPDGLIIQMLKAADSKDAAIDRNNPLFSAEQKDSIYRSNVFGFEDQRMIEIDEQEKIRQELYINLKTNLPKYFNGFNDFFIREQVLDHIKTAFEQGISDTTRPQNDTSLWGHAYAVASILKVLSVHNFYNKDNLIKSFNDVRFGIFGIGWDGVKFISYGQKIGDIVARKKLLEHVKISIRKNIEFKYPVGNMIYEDDNGIYFIVPVHFDGSQYLTIRSAILKEVFVTIADKTNGEFQPSMVDISETDTLTALVRAIQNMKVRIHNRFDSSNEAFEYFKENLLKFESGKTICPICRLRAVEKENAPRKICKACRLRRELASQEQKNCNSQTVFLDEIVDKNKRASLIVAQFALKDWLNGKMIRSLFVSEAEGMKKEIESLGTIAPFDCTEEEKLKRCFGDIKYDYNRIKGDIDSFSKSDPESQKRAKQTAFLYVHGRKEMFHKEIKPLEIWSNWEKIKNVVEKELSDPDKKDILLYNLLCAKSPTPSTILDVWWTTLRFFEKEVSEKILQNSFPQLNRLKIQLKEKIHFSGRGTLEANLTDKRGVKKNIEIIFKGESRIEVIGVQYSPESESDFRGAKLKIVDKEYKEELKDFTIQKCSSGESFLPYRVITESPNIFMVLVPADKAIGITDLIYKKYIKHFGKVIGRLPLSIGNIFFGRRMPMFVVLDAGKRMLNNFAQLAENKDKDGVEFNVIKGTEKASSKKIIHLSTSFAQEKGIYHRTIQLDLAIKRGDGTHEEFYHPYFIVDSKENNLKGKNTLFKTVAGDVVHFSEIADGDKLILNPNYYDFEFLDTNIRRHRMGIDFSDLRRRSRVANFKSKPLLLDELHQKIQYVWNKLIGGNDLKGLTDTKLRNLQTLWLTKYQQWNVDLGAPDTDNSKMLWMQLIETSIFKELPNISDPDRNLILETIKNGLFFEILELYLGILKMRIDV